MRTKEGQGGKRDGEKRGGRRDDERATRRVKNEKLVKKNEMKKWLEDASLTPAVLFIIMPFIPITN